MNIYDSQYSQSKRWNDGKVTTGDGGGEKCERRSHRSNMDKRKLPKNMFE